MSVIGAIESTRWEWHKRREVFFAAGLADLNHRDLNHWFKSRFKSIDFFKNITDLNHSFRKLF